MSFWIGLHGLCFYLLSRKGLALNNLEKSPSRLSTWARAGGIPQGLSVTRPPLRAARESAYGADLFYIIVEVTDLRPRGRKKNKTRAARDTKNPGAVKTKTAGTSSLSPSHAVCRCRLTGRVRCFAGSEPYPATSRLRSYATIRAALRALLITFSPWFPMISF
jgi:hypothetical protein